MEKDFLQELLDSGYFEIVDSYESSKTEMKEYEKKYGISSNEFYNNICEGMIAADVSCEDRADWIFLCKCFVNSGGKLVELNQANSILHNKEISVAVQKSQYIDEISTEHIKQYKASKRRQIGELIFREEVETASSRFFTRVCKEFVQF